MRDHACIGFECLAPVTFEGRRGGKSKSVAATLSVDVMVPKVGKAGAPVVFATHSIAFQYRKPAHSIQRLHYDGGFWQNATGDGFGIQPDVTEDALRDDVRRVDRTEGVLSLSGVPWEGCGPRGVVPTDARILEDGREAVAEAVRARLGRALLLVDGALHRRVPCPSISVCDERSGTWSIGVPDWISGRNWGYAFAADRFEELRAFLAANERPGGVKTVKCEFSEVTHCGSEVLAYEEGPRNARYAIHTAMYAVHEILPNLPEAPILALAELARIRDGLDDGSTTPGEADAALARLDALRPVMGTTTHLMHAIRIGRDALARSLKEARGGTVWLHDDDMSAMDGLVLA